MPQNFTEEFERITFRIASGSQQITMLSLGLEPFSPLRRGALQSLARCSAKNHVKTARQEEGRKVISPSGCATA